MSDIETPHLSIVLPAFNEAENLETAVERSLALAPHLPGELEVIVVDDGSRDATPEVLEDLLRRHHPRLRALVHPRNLGYGTAMRTGFTAARGDLVFFTDSDNQFDVADLLDFLPLMGKCDMAIGFRVRRDDALSRRILSWIFNRMVAALFRLRVRDVNCAFKLMRREVVDRVTLECDSFFVSTELIARARRRNFRITEKGVRHYPRVAGETTVRPGDIPRTLREIARMWRRINLPSGQHVDEVPAKEEPLEPETVERVPTRA